MKNEFSGIKKKIQNMVAGSVQSAKLPSLRVMAKEFGCTAPTVLRAVRDLELTGCLQAHPEGGYICVSDKSIFSGVKRIALIVNSGMMLFEDSYIFRMKYNAVYALTCTGECSKLAITEIHIQSYRELTKILRTSGFAGVVMVDYNEKSYKTASAFCKKKGIPFGCFGWTGPHGIMSVHYDCAENFRKTFDYLRKRGSRKILAVSLNDNPWNEAMKQILPEQSGKFEALEFMVDTEERVFDYVLGNTGENGKKFDTVFFVMGISCIYEKVHASAPDCCCVMPEFAVAHIRNFTGLELCFDVEEAGKKFGQAMSRLLNGEQVEEPHGIIPFYMKERIHFQQ